MVGGSVRSACGLRVGRKKIVARWRYRPFRVSVNLPGDRLVVRASHGIPFLVVVGPDHRFPIFRDVWYVDSVIAETARAMAKSGKPEIVLTDGERERLEGIMGNPRSRRKHAWRAHIILELGSGRGLAETMRRTGKSKPTIWRWWDRFLDEGVEGLLHDATRPPGKKPISEDKAQAVADLAISSPPQHASYWTLRAIAKEIGGVSFSTVRDILQRRGLTPHKVRMLDVSRDPPFKRRIRDMVGLYAGSSDHAIVFSMGGKIRAKAQGQGGKSGPIAARHPETRTPGYGDDAIARLMATLGAVSGEATGRMGEGRRPGEFSAFLERVAEAIDPDTEIHAVLDGFSPRKAGEIHGWVGRHPRWSFHFTAPPVSWTDVVEDFLRESSRRRSGGVILDSLERCVTAAEVYIDRRDGNAACAFHWSEWPE